MRNLKTETLQAIKSTGKTVEDVAYCSIKESTSWNDEENRTYCEGDINIDTLNFEYDDGYGGQEVKGFIVFKDNTWLQRGEYDGSEWWEYMSVPQLPTKEVL